MKLRKLHIAIGLVIGLILVLGIAAPVSAGVEPSPFIPNKLNAIANQLYAVDAKLSAVLTPPPDDSKPPPDDNYRGLVRMLEVTGDQLDRSYQRIVDTCGGVPPDDGRVADALNEIIVATQEIVDTVGGVPPDDNLPVDALANVMSKAGDIASLARDYLGTIPLPGLG